MSDVSNEVALPVSETGPPVAAQPHGLSRALVLGGILAVLSAAAVGVWLTLPRDFWLSGATSTPAEWTIKAPKEGGPGGGGTGGSPGGGGHGGSGNSGSLPPGHPPIGGESKGL